MSELHELKGLSVLLVEDEEDLRRETAGFLELFCGSVGQAAHGREALAQVEERLPDVVVSDIRMPVMDGLEMAGQLKESHPELPVIFCTAFTDTAYLIRAIELGAAAFVRKPVNTDELLGAIRRAAEPVLRQRQLERLQRENATSRSLLFGASDAMQRVAEQLLPVAECDFSVLLEGEAGSGKSTLAMLLHDMSRRRKHPLVVVDACAREPEQLEAELFGVPGGRGRPTAANLGLLASADGGTLLLDAPERLPLPLQARLLRVIEEGRCTPAGSLSAFPCDLRLLTTTSADLGAAAAAGRFHQGLFIQLSDTVVHVPPLRERIEDIPQLAVRLLCEAADDLEIPCPELPPDALVLLKKQSWPGNCRQLRQVLRRSLLTDSRIITPATLKGLLGGAGSQAAGKLPRLNLVELERWAIGEALTACGGRKMEAAKVLGISYNTFKDKLGRYGLAG